MPRIPLALVLACFPLLVRAQPATVPATQLDYINTHFENASPIWYDIAPDGVVRVHLHCEHERRSPNLASAHFHFQLQASAGATITLEFVNLDNIYNGRPASIAREVGAVVVSEDGRSWRSIQTRQLPGQRVQVTIVMPGPRLYVARAEPYRVSDLDRLLAEIKTHPLIEITPIGKTVEGRELEIIRVGADRPRRVFIRARAHAWEPAGNWIVQGLIHRLLQEDPQARRWLDEYCVYILPMANKDGVAHGLSRFNLNGKDLNRDWAEPADPTLAPENAALEAWLAKMIQAGRKPDLALELHNDGHGNLHVHPAATLPPDVRARYVDHMTRLEALLRRHTWFTEGIDRATPAKPATLPEGWLARFGIEGAVHEFNASWIDGLDDFALGKHWESYGAGLAEVFSEYLKNDGK